MAPEPKKDDTQQQQAQPEGTPPPGDTLVVEGQIEKPDPPATTGTGPARDDNRHGEPRTFSTEDIEKARREEKDKLYSSMEEMKTELKELRRYREDQAKAEADAKKKAEEDEAKRQADEKRKKEEEMEIKALLEQKEQEWNQRFQQIEEEAARKDELLAKERRYNELVAYRARRLEEESDSIMPELRDLVALGNSEEEIEASLSALQDRTQRILEQVANGQRDARQHARGVAATAPPVGPLESQPEFQQLSTADLKNMDIATYGKNRERLLGAVSQQVRQRGPYGG